MLIADDSSVFILYVLLKFIFLSFAEFVLNFFNESFLCGE